MLNITKVFAKSQQNPPIYFWERLQYENKFPKKNDKNNRDKLYRAAKSHYQKQVTHTRKTQALETR